MVEIDSVLLGDNPLFGINHLAQEKARERSFTLGNIASIAEIIQHGVNLGINGFVVSTYPSLYDLIKFFKNETDVLERLNFYPIIPYAQGYVTKVTEKGIPGTVKDMLSRVSFSEKTQILGRGTLSLMKNDFQSLFKIFLDIEIIPLKQVKTKIVFLHDVITDLALGLGAKEIFEIFLNYVKDKHDIQPGLVTKNFPLLVNSLDRWKIEKPPIMTSFNKIGTQMNPTPAECEKCILENDVQVIAMNTLSGGYLKPKDAFDYLEKFPKIKSIVVGSSTKEHIDEFFHLLSKNQKLRSV